MRDALPSRSYIWHFWYCDLTILHDFNLQADKMKERYHFETLRVDGRKILFVKRVKLNLSQCVPRRQHAGVELQLRNRWVQWSTSGWALLSLRESTGTHCREGSVGTTIGLDAFKDSETSYSCGESKHDPTVIQPITQSLYRL